jgi:hypothetical protein
MKKLIKKYLEYKLKFRSQYQRKFITVETKLFESTVGNYNSWRVFYVNHFQERKGGSGDLTNYTTIGFEREKHISKDFIKKYFKIS